MARSPWLSATRHFRDLRFSPRHGGGPMEERLQSRPQSITVQAALHLAVDDHRNGACLFRNDDRDGVVLFSQANRSTVTRAILLAQPGIDREREEARRGRNAIVLYDDGAVMQRRRKL